MRLCTGIYSTPFSAEGLCDHHSIVWQFVLFHTNVADRKKEHENFNIELQRSRGIAIAVLGRRCLMGRLLLRSSMRLIGLVEQHSVHI